MTCLQKNNIFSIDNEEELDEECTYLCGNSLGLLPKRSRELVIQELDAWGQKYKVMQFKN